MAKVKSSRGIWLVVALFLLGGAVLCGLFLARRLLPHPNLPYGPPDQPVRVVSYNILKGDRGRDRILDEIRRLGGDVVLLQEVKTDQAEGLARDLGMHVAFRSHPNLPSEGLAVLSRYPLRDVTPVIDAAGRTCAIFADAVADGKRFIAASVHLQATSSLGSVFKADRIRGEEIQLIHNEWKRRGGYALVIAGDFNQIPMGGNYRAVTTGLIDVLDELGKDGSTLGDGILRARVDYILCSNEWRAVEGGVGKNGASDHRPIWAVLRGRAGSTPTTR